MTHRTKHILVVDLYHTGHHGWYLECLISYWHSEKLDCRLTVAVSPQMTAEQPRIKSAVEAVNSPDLQYLEIQDELLSSIDTRSLIQKDQLHTRIVSSLLDQEQPTCCLLMYFDHCQLGLSSSAYDNFDAFLAGVYFRPSMHYPVARLGFKGLIVALRKAIVLRRAAANKSLKFLFSLDPFAVPTIRRVARSTKVVPLPDPTETPNNRPDGGLSKKSGTLSLLLCGAIDSRKGVIQVLDALKYFEYDRNITLRIAGPISESEHVEIRAAIAEVSDLEGATVTVDDRYLSEDEISYYIAMSDAVLVTYINHIGSSNILVKAASHGVPVVCSDFGLIGQLTKHHMLGLTVDARKPRDIARAINHLASGQFEFDPQRAKKYSEANTPHEFAQTIFDNLLSTDALA